MDDVIFSEDSQIFQVQYLRNYAIKMHRVNAKKFQKFFSKDLFYKINSDSDFIAPLTQVWWIWTRLKFGGLGRDSTLVDSYSTRAFSNGLGLDPSHSPK